ncbi:hypothetical protein HYQ46_006969 [Verticillium longisporum]|nr:hypothetical protein HYQ46_006969 [Verticillium longisporum]
MHARRRGNPAKVGNHLTPRRQVGLPAIDVSHLATGLLEHEHGAGVVPDLAEALPLLVDPKGHVGVAEGEGGPARHPAEEIVAGVGEAHARGNLLVDAGDGRVGVRARDEAQIGVRSQVVSSLLADKGVTRKGSRKGGGEDGLASKVGHGDRAVVILVDVSYAVVGSGQDDF